jgi:DNA (cytosine-5)-methyltransferase 1
MMKLGSLFSGIGMFELGLERAIPNLKTIWQVEQDHFCQSILKKHWPKSIIYDDVKTVGKHNLEPVDILCGGFPCQDISTAGTKEGLNGKKSSLWFEMWRIISELRPQIIVLENVSAITFRGLGTVLGGLSSLGYDAEWGIISARDFGAPHLRKRWFCVAYSNSKRSKEHRQPVTMEKRSLLKCGNSKNERVYIKNHWKKNPNLSGLCSLDDGMSARVAKLRSLGNAIVPQCSEYIGLQILKSGILDDLSRA